MAFTFASADMVAETDASGAITFAAGAFRSMFNAEADAFVGRPVHHMVAPADREMVDQALVLLAGPGRLPPVMVRMADAARTGLALAGLALGVKNEAPRFCFTFAKPPAPPACVLRDGSAQTLARRTEARLRAGEACTMELLQVATDHGDAAATSLAIEGALDGLTDGVSGMLAPGRYGFVSAPGDALASVAALLEGTLRTQGLEATVSSRRLQVGGDGLSPMQAARALRQALTIFARDGADGLAQAGFSGGLAGYVRQARTSVGRLRRAIRGGQFAMAFQPVVRLDDRKVHHHEALIRPRPIEGCAFSSPQEFVLMVESLGLADELDLAVAQAACEAAARAQAPVAFNMSAQSAQSPAFRERLVTLLRASAAARAGLMMVEMTETADIEDVAEARRTADALRALKIPFCLDDFGAGAADMRLLRSLAADVVKLDGSYLPGVCAGGRERAFVAAMAEVARAVGAEVVAERVETEAEADTLRILGVQYGQGWHFGRPGPLPPRAIAGSRAARPQGETEMWG